MSVITYPVDCGDLGELDLLVEYDYQPAERQTYDYPGCDAEVDATGVTCLGRDVTWLFLRSLQDSEAFYQYVLEKEREALYESADG